MNGPTPGEETVPAADGLEGLTDEYRVGRARTVADAQVAAGHRAL